METAPNNSILQVTQEEMEKGRKLLDTNREKIEIHLDAIKEWIQKEGHLADAFQYLDNTVLENLYILEKGSVERTKRRIDRFLTTRGLVPEICLNKTFDEFDGIMRDIQLIMLPKLNPEDLSRVGVMQLVSEKANDIDPLTFCRYVMIFFDYRLRFDYCMGSRYIIDFKYFNLAGLAKLNPFLFKKTEVVCLDGYGFRIKGIHIINPPFFVDKIVVILKMVFREKIASRIHVHKTLEDLHKEISKEILPVEYGGNSISYSAIFEKFKDTLKSEEGRKFMENTNKLVSDDSKRSSYTFNAEYLGTPGSFRQLVVD